MGYTVFISYAIKDSGRLQIPRLAMLLAKMKDIDKVHYWEGWSGYPKGNIIEFMERNIRESDVFILVVSPASNASDNCEKERVMALFQNKRIIPLFEDFNQVPSAYQPYLGINLQGKSLDQILDDLHNIITQKGPPTTASIPPTPMEPGKKRSTLMEALNKMHKGSDTNFSFEADIVRIEEIRKTRPGNYFRRITIKDATTTAILVVWGSENNRQHLNLFTGRNPQKIIITHPLKPREGYSEDFWAHETLTTVEVMGA